MFHISRTLPRAPRTGARVAIRSTYTTYASGMVVEVAEPDELLVGAFPVAVKHEDGTHAAYSLDEVETLDEAVDDVVEVLTSNGARRA